jgi:hypothetical protein
MVSLFCLLILPACSYQKTMNKVLVADGGVWRCSQSASQVTYSSNSALSNKAKTESVHKFMREYGAK